MEEFLEVAPRFSLKTMGLLDKPSAPLLGVNGKLDDQAPVADIYLLLEHGNPKSARIYPDGHHMGRTPGQPAGAHRHHDRRVAERAARVRRGSGRQQIGVGRAIALDGLADGDRDRARKHRAAATKE